MTLSTKLVVKHLTLGLSLMRRCRDDEGLYRATAFDRSLPLVFDRSIAVYEVATEPRRTLSYTNLRRRFPLRLMAPR